MLSYLFLVDAILFVSFAGAWSQSAVNTNAMLRCRSCMQMGMGPKMEILSGRNMDIEVCLQLLITIPVVSIMRPFTGARG